MSIERLEGRQLLAALTSGTSVDGTASANFAALTGSAGLEQFFEQQLDRSFERAARLSSYTPEEVIDASQWVLKLSSTGTEQQLSSSLGAQNLLKWEAIEGTYIYTIPGGTNREGLGPIIQSTPGVQYAYPLVKHEVNKRFVPNDPLYGNQWHLNNTGQTGGTPNEDANLEAAWDLARGTGIVIGIVDDGVQHTHPDLVGHYLANLGLDLVGGDNNPLAGAGDYHGTAVAGVATANTNNGLGVAGAAPDARFTAIRLLGANQTDATEALAISHQLQEIDIYNNSWGPPDGYGTFDAAGPLTMAALQGAITTGRGGLGNLMMWAAGNGGLDDDNSNYDAYANSWYTTAIGAIDHTGNRAPYSEPGANVLVTTYSLGAFSGTPGITTTDIVGADGYNFAAGAALDDDPLFDLNYTSTFSGTSSSTPLASGIVALMLSANPNLTWRDVNRILIETARKNDPTDPDWTTNGAGYDINHNYGFGSIDAAAAVNLARTWTNLTAPTIFSQATPFTVNQPIPNGQGELQWIVTVGTDINVEQVELVLDISHAFPEDLEIIIESPDGTESILSQEHTAFFDTTDQLRGWSFTSVRHWGENARGDWLVTVRDTVPLSAGTWNNFSINFLGTPGTPGTTPTRIAGEVFSDTNGNGVFEVAENFLPGVTVFLDTNSNGTFDTGEPTDITNSNGRYVFNNVTPGTHIVDVVVPPLSTLTFPAVGSYTVNAIANQTTTAGLFGIRPAPVGVGPFVLNNGPGNASLNVGVDGFGSFGSAVGSDSGDATNATYDPFGAIPAAGTTYESGVAIGFLSGQREFLSTGMDSFFANPQVTGTPMSGTSSFVYNNLLFQLQQRLTPLNNASGQRIGSQLTQTYTITNVGTQPQQFDLVRYLDGDLRFDGDLVDGGGRLISGPNEVMFETDTATGRADSTTFVGITAVGGTQSTTTRYQASSFSGLYYQILSGANLNQTIAGDGPDPDQFVDAGQGYDITLALQNIFNLAPGQVGTYTTSTLFGTGAPGEVYDPPAGPPEPPPPPPPFSFGGVVTNDLNGNGQNDPGEPGLPNAIVYLDINNDGQLGLGEPAQITNNRGEYSFAVREGTYIVRQAAIAGWQPSAPLAGSYTATGASGQTISNLFFGNTSSIDYGDAPNSYSTLVASNGPSHSIIPGFYLGTGIDGEGDGQPSAKALGDDQFGNDPDDGVTIVTPMVPGQTASIDVRIHNGGKAAGMLHGWIDFNADGDFNDAGERVFSNQRVVDGVNRLSFAVPAGAQLGNTFARFRYGYGNAIGPTGAVVGGEVEDYLFSIVGNKPTARPDSYVVAANTTANKLDVLANDVASALGPISIVGTTNGSLGGIVQVGTDQTILYTPQPGLTTGTDVFSYTISDGKGGLSTTQVTITLGIPTIHPTAIDDLFKVNTNSVSNTLNILANDLAPQSPVTTVLVNQNTLKGGYVAVNTGTNTLRYTPPFNYVGVDQFEYTMRDARGLESKAVVTVQVGMSGTDDVAGLELSITNAQGNPLTSVEVGSEFQLRIAARDKRNLPTDPGVIAAYLDVLYNQTLATPKVANNSFGFEIAFSSTFNQLRTGSAAQPGLLDEIGAQRSSTPTDVGPTDLVTITFVAQAVGNATFTADPANVAINHDVRMGSPAFTVPIDKVTYGSTSISIVAAPRFKNVKNVHDVDGDTAVTPSDVLMIINELNTRGAASLATRSQSATSPTYFDVDGDNMLTPSDVLQVINFLNTFGATRGEDVYGGSNPASEPEDLFEALAKDVATKWR